MCVVAIVDADSLRVLATRQGPGDDLFLSWIRRRHGVLAFPSSGQYFTEVRGNGAVMELIRRYDQGGQLRKIATAQLASADSEIREKHRRSNDLHILALALASNATILCSNDGDLRSDFRNSQILPKSGKRRRILYPRDGTRKQRREFLNRQRCASRRQN